MRYPSRRHFLAAAVGTGFAGGAGCVEATTDALGVFDDDLAGETTPAGPTADEGEGPPVADRQLPIEYTLEELDDEMLDGGPGVDGIPSIDDPTFNEADDPPPNLQEESPVFGVEINGDARAYPQYVLVWHEIVNDVVGGESVAVTYCPLTGTAQGFYRRDVEFGVSGRLINSNLVMFDRETRSLWPQMLAWAIRGPHTTNFLKEFQVIWTTWERWREQYPDTLVHSEDTGFIRNYGDDPYGTYVPLDGYYKFDYTIFPLLDTSEEFRFKEVVIGMRNADGSMCVSKDRLRERSVVRGRVNGVGYASVYDPALDTGYVYRNPDGVRIIDDGSEYLVEGSLYPAAELPLDRQIAFDAMWMAWYGYYPSTAIHGRRDVRGR